MVLMLYCINWPNFIVWFPLRLEILAKFCIAIVCKPRCDIINFEINLVFLIKPFLGMTKKSKYKLKFKVKWKAFFIIFKVLSIARNRLRPESALLKTVFFQYILFPFLLRLNIRKMIYVIKVKNELFFRTLWAPTQTETQFSMIFSLKYSELRQKIACVLLLLKYF